MSSYNDFVFDFPGRCREVLELAYEPAKARDREVTLLIMTAAAAFLVPFERLRPGTSTDHPAQNRRLFPELAHHLDSALGRPFIESPFHQGKSSSWALGKIKGTEVAPDCYAPLTEETPASQVLGIIRNALAHGNISTTTEYQNGQNPLITALMFFSEDRKADGVYNYVHVSPDEFHIFLLRWLAFLNNHNIAPIVVAESLAQAT
jgi:hypothetical protein